MGMALEQCGIDRLSPEERCELINLNWNSLSEDFCLAPPVRHLRELAKRVKVADAQPDAGESWEVVLARLSKQL
jgi:hypothetical protein